MRIVCICTEQKQFLFDFDVSIMHSSVAFTLYFNIG